MTNYSWDLGFDLGAVQPPGPNGTTLPSYLETGFVALLSTGHVITAPVNLQVGDVISFNVFNVSGNSISGAETWSINGGEIKFGSGEVNQTADSPFQSTTLQISSASSRETGTSTVFSGGSEITFPVFPNAAASQAIVNTGKYLMTVILNVQSGSGTEQRVFTIDPEMIIGGAG